MARRLRQGIPPADHAESLSCVESRAGHEMFGAGFDHTQKIRVCGENPLPHPAQPVAEGSGMTRRLRQGIPPADHAESPPCVASLAGHEMFGAGFDYTQKIRVCGENPLPHPAHAVAWARVMPRRLRQGIPRADHAESPACVASLAGHEMFGCGFDHTQKIRVCGENPLPHPAYRLADERASMSHAGVGIDCAVAARGGRGVGAACSPGTPIFWAWSEPHTQISWRARDCTDESDSGWSREGMPPPRPSRVGTTWPK